MKINKKIQSKQILFHLIMAVAIVGFFLLFSEQKKPENQASEAAASSEIAQESHYKGKKLLYINSYHKGYDWSDGIERGMREVLDNKGIEISTIEMDTKRNADDEFKKKVAEKAKKEIEDFKPDVIIASDDNAFKYVIQEYYKDADIPVVFCGLNWNASIYGAPYSNTTGVVEVALTLYLIDYLKQYSGGDANRIGYLSADVLTERKNLEYYDRLFGLNFDAVYFVKTMEEWKEAFKKLQEEVDIIVFENNAGISDWDDKEAEDFALANIKVPVGTMNEWVMNVSLIGLTKVPEEQGELSALAALRILDGEKPSEIPVITNEKGDLMLNFKMAEELGIIFSSLMLKSAKSIIQ